MTKFEQLSPDLQVKVKDYITKMSKEQLQELVLRRLTNADIIRMIQSKD
jgi:hypothetical protein